MKPVFYLSSKLLFSNFSQLIYHARKLQKLHAAKISGYTITEFENIWSFKSKLDVFWHDYRFLYI